MDAESDFVDAILAAPLGVVLLARVEARPSGGWARLERATVERVQTATAYVENIDLAELLELVLHVSMTDAGPWIPNAANTVAAAYQDANERAPIARAIDRRFAECLHNPFDPSAQQWWTGASEKPQPRFQNFDSVYGSGQFSWAGLWTITEPAARIHESLADSWEMVDHPITRWSLPAYVNTSIYEIHRPKDWFELVTRYPREAIDESAHWELPSINQRPSELDRLLDIQGQHAARRSVKRHLVPDWAAVAADYDGVHLSWAGVITSEGFITDASDGSVAMLRYWFSERTHWLRDGFGDPRPLEPPTIDEADRVPQRWQAESGEQRLERDLAVIEGQLGRRR